MEKYTHIAISNALAVFTCTIIALSNQKENGLDDNFIIGMFSWIHIFVRTIDPNSFDSKINITITLIIYVIGSLSMFISYILSIKPVIFTCMVVSVLLMYFFIFLLAIVDLKFDHIQSCIKFISEKVNPKKVEEKVNNEELDLLNE